MHKGFVITSAPYLQPCYRINPFRTSNLSVNRIIEPDESAERYLDSRFGKGRYLLTSSGKGALEFSLGELYLKRDDVVTIMTTSATITSAVALLMRYRSSVRGREKLKRRPKLSL